MEFGFQHGQFGEQVAVKLSTIKSMMFKLGITSSGCIRTATGTCTKRAVCGYHGIWPNLSVSRPMAMPSTSSYRWARTTNRFIPALNFNRRHGKSIRDHEAEKFDVLTLEQARAAYDRIRHHPDPQGRFLAFMALLYSQTIAASSLRRADLVRSEKSGCWVIKRGSDDGFELEPEVSVTLDECLSLADQHSRFLGRPEEDYIFPGRNKYYISRTVSSEKIREASGHKGEVLRRTGVVNMFRSGQKTMGTIVLRDQLKVSVPVIQHCHHSQYFATSAKS